MEDKLKELKENFCKFYCEDSDKKLYCEYCQVDEYIRFIRDDIK